MGGDPHGTFGEAEMPWTGTPPNETAVRTDGTRTGDTTWVQAKAAAVKIRADDHDVHDTDQVDMVNACLKKDGGNQATANLQFGGYVADNHGSGSARDHSASIGQIQDNGVAYAATSGTNVLTATLSPAITAYAAGQLFLAKLGGTNTGWVTINYNGVGAKSVKQGSDGADQLAAGNMTAGRLALLAYDGTNFQDLTAPEFPPGTKMLFQQTDAPVGWTKDAVHDDKAIRLTTGTVGTGGAVAFETAFASQTPSGTVGGTAITEAQMPSHYHTLANSDSVADVLSVPGGSYPFLTLQGNNADPYDYRLNGSGSTPTLGKSGSTGSGNTHTHSFTGNAINLDVSYVDCIIATKD